MSRYRRSHTPGATFFFTVTLADRKVSTLTEHVGQLREAYGAVARSRPFETMAICVLPNHLHALWQLPQDDADFSTRWSCIKSAFSRALPESTNRSASKRAKREKGIWQRRFWGTRFVTSVIYGGTSTTSITTRSSMAWSVALPIGRIPVFTGTSAMGG